MAELVLIYNTVTGAYVTNQVGSTHLADSAVVSGKIGAGAVISGAIASGHVGTPHIAAAAITSALVAAGALATPHIANQGILSAALGAAFIADPHILALGIGGGSLANQAIVSAKVGAGVLAAPHIANQGLLSSVYGGGSIGAAHVANQGLLSSVYGAGSIGAGHVADYGLVSGKFASGAIGETALASGISIDISETSQEPSYRAAVPVAAYEAAYFSASGYFGLARTQTPGSLPAVGLATGAVISGAIGTIGTYGRITNTSWNFSGYIGKVVFVGTSSEPVAVVPSASGYLVQRLGSVVSPVTVLLAPNMYVIQVGQ